MRHSLKIVGIGRYLPARVIDNCDIASRCGTTPERIYARCGVRLRHRACRTAGETATAMGASAAKEALKVAGLAPERLDLILNASGTPEQALPDNAPFIQRHLGLGQSGIPCLSVNAACLSFLAALDVAAAFLATERYKRILIVSSEVTSIGVDFQDAETGPLFGDGAAAVLVTRPAPNDPACLHGVRFETYGDGVHLTEIVGGGSRLPPTAPESRPEHGLFRMQGRALLRLAAQHGRSFLKRFAEDVGADCLDQALLIPHQPSRAGMEMFVRLGFTPERTVSTLECLGNCVAASLPLTLYEAISSRRLLPGSPALMLGTAAGVSFGGGLITY